MKNLYAATWESLLVVFLSGVGIYLAVIMLTRIFGKRSFSKMSSFDFAMTVAVGSVITTTLLSTSVSLTEGAFGLLVLYTLQFLAAYFRRSKRFERTIDNTPLLLMDGPEILKQNLKEACVTESDLCAKLREANVIDMSDIRAVVFETTGDISVLHTSDASTELEQWLLKDVKR